MSNLSAPYFHDPDTARTHLEEIRWPNGPVCPHCGENERIYEARGKNVRPGVRICGNKNCRKQFTVTVGTLFEGSHVPLNKWFQAAYLLCASKKGMSSHQLHRILGVMYKTAWFMTHRLREAMKDGPIFKDPMGGESSSIQADETYFGTKKGAKKGGGGFRHKMAVVSLVSEGKSRTFHVECADAATVRNILVTHADRASELHTDESRLYVKVGEEFAKHRTVVHIRGQYVGPHGETTNNVENFFSVFKRGMRGVYQHCAEKHLQRYLHEFDFRYNMRKVDDWTRTLTALGQIGSKRLMYRHS